MNKIFFLIIIVVTMISSLVYGETIKYKIVSEETTRHKAITDKLSSYSHKELIDLPFVIRKEYRIVISEGLSKADIENVVNKMIAEKLVEDNRIDEMIIFIYDNEKDIVSVYTIGRAVWGVDGEFGNVTPQIAKSDDKSKHRIILDIKSISSAGLTVREMEIARAFDAVLWGNAEMSEEDIAVEISKEFGISKDELNKINEKFFVWKFRK